MGELRKIIIARGSEENIKRGLVRGVHYKIIEEVVNFLDPSVIDNNNNVHLWGVPLKEYVLRIWEKIDEGDILIAIPISKSGKHRTCYVSIIVSRYPQHINEFTIEKSRSISRKIWKEINVYIDRKKQGKEKVIYKDFPLLLFVNPKVLPVTEEHLLNIFQWDRKKLSGYRHSIAIVKQVSPDAIDKLYKSIFELPPIDIITELLEKAYLEIAKGYGVAAPTSPKVWGHPRQKGVFELLNNLLEKAGYRSLSWEEFRNLLSMFDSPSWYGIVHVSWAIGKTGQVEPLTIAIYRSIK